MRDGKQNYVIVGSFVIAMVAALIVAMVVVGGYVRLSRAGLSIVEWDVLSGIIPPIGDAALEKFLVLVVEPVRPCADVFETFSRHQLPDIALGLNEVLIGVDLDGSDLTEGVDVGAARQLR